jgi:hypothetical protein
MNMLTRMEIQLRSRQSPIDDKRRSGIARGRNNLLGHNKRDVRHIIAISTTVTSITNNASENRKCEGEKEKKELLHCNLSTVKKRTEGGAALIKVEAPILPPQTFRGWLKINGNSERSVHSHLVI